jgi:hypothetical protein
LCAPAPFSPFPRQKNVVFSFFWFFLTGLLSCTGKKQQRSQQKGSADSQKYSDKSHNYIAIGLFFFSVKASHTLLGPRKTGVFFNWGINIFFRAMFINTTDSETNKCLNFQGITSRKYVNRP